MAEIHGVPVLVDARAIGRVYARGEADEPIVDGVIKGWAAPEGDEPAMVELVVDGAVAARARADIARDDVPGDEVERRSGFSLRIPAAFYSGVALKIDLRRAGDARSLEGAPFEATLAPAPAPAPKTGDPGEGPGTLARGRALMADEKWLEAIAVFLSIVQARPQDAPAQADLGRAYTRLQRWPEAVRHLTLAADLDPANASTARTLAHTLLRAGRFAEAVARLKAGLARSGPNAELEAWLSDAERGLARVLAAQADTQIAAGDQIGAVATLRELLVLRPDDPAVGVRLARILVSKDQSEEALALVERAVALKPGDPRVDRLHARLLLDHGRAAEASAIVDRLLAAEPGAEDVVRLQTLLAATPELGKAAGEALLAATRAQRAERWDDARAGYATVLADRPDHPGVLGRLGQIFARLGEWDAAVAYFIPVTAAHPDSATAHGVLGKAFNRLERWPDAVRHLTLATDLDPADLGSARTLAHTFLRMGRFTEAADRLEALLEGGDPGKAEPDTELTRWLAEARRGEAKALAAQAETEQAAGDHAAAARTLGRLVALRPDEPALRMRLARALVAIEELDEALIHVERAVALNPGDPRTDQLHARILGEARRGEAKALAAQAETEQAAGDHAAAARTLGRLVALRPDEPALRMRLARALVAIEEPDEALIHVERAVALNPGDPRTDRLHARILLDNGQTAEATALLERLLADDPGNDDLQRLLEVSRTAPAVSRRTARALRAANQAYKDEDWGQARSAYQEVLSRNPDHAVATVRLALILGRTGRWEDIVAGFAPVVEADPTNAHAQAVLGRAYNRLEAWPEAIRHLGLAADLDPTDIVSARTLAHTLIRSGAFAEASRRLQAVLDRTGPDAELEQWLADARRGHGKALAQAADAHLEAGDPEAAVAVLRDLAEVRADDPVILVRLGRTLLKIGEPEEALERLEQAHALQPGDPRADRQRARALMEVGRPEAAAVILKALLAQYPDNDDIHRALTASLGAPSLGPRLGGVLAAANRSWRDLDWEAAKAGYQAVLTEQPDYVLAHGRLAQILVMQDLWDEAIGHLEFAHRVEPDNLQIARDLAGALIRAGRAEDARGVLDPLVLADPADAKALLWLTQVCADLGDRPAAFAAAQAVEALTPGDPRVQMLLARLYGEVADWPAALERIDRVLAATPEDYRALQIRGDVLMRLARFDESEAAFKHSLRLAPRDPLTSARFSDLLMLQGELAWAFARNERRRAIGAFEDENKAYPQPEWEGQPELPGRLLLWAEQGLGLERSLLHSGFIPLLLELGLSLVVEIDAALIPLLQRSFPAVRFVAHGAASLFDDPVSPDRVSHQIPLASLARWLRPTRAAFASTGPFLKPDEARVRALRAAGAGPGLRIGVSAGAATSADGPGLGDLCAALDGPGRTLITLAAGDAASLDALAAEIAALDVVVCADGVIAHLAGAIGTPCLLLLPASPAPYWQAQGDRSIWYPALSLFRRSVEAPDWTTVLTRARAAIDAFGADPDTVWLAGALFREGPVQARVTDPGTVVANALAGAFARRAEPAVEVLLARARALRPDDPDLAIYDTEFDIGPETWEARDRAYAMLAEAAPDEKLVLSRFVTLRIEQFRLEEACRLLDQLREARPEDLQWPLQQADLYLRLGRIDDAAQALDAAAALEATPTDVEAVDALSMRGRVFEARGQFRQAEAAYRAAVETGGERIRDRLLLAGALRLREAPEEAIRIYDRILETEDDPNAAFWRTTERIRSGQTKTRPLPAIKGEVPAVGPDDLVVFLTVDSVYFWDHALALAVSLDANAPGTACHIHVVNPDDDVAAGWTILKRLLPHVRLTMTTEKLRLDGVGRTFVHTYYASVRFVRLAEIMRRAPARYLCLDADCVVFRPLDDLAAVTSGRDLMAWQRFDEQPQFMIVASAIHATPTERTRAFLDEVADMIAPVLGSGEAAWYLDQIVISHLLNRHAIADSLDVGQLPLRYNDWFFQADSVIWTGKGERKKTDEAYMAAVARFHRWKSLADLTAEEDRRVAESARRDDG